MINVNEHVAPHYDILTGLDCNLRCKYCFEGSKGNKFNSIDQCVNFVRACYYEDYENDEARFRYSKKRSPSLYLIGGEPLLHVDILDATMTEWDRLNHEMGFEKFGKASIVTNGTLMVLPKVQEFFKKWHKSIALTFSIDGDKFVHDLNRVDINGKGSYDRSIAGLHWYNEAFGKRSYGVKATYTKETASHYADGVISLFEEGARGINANVPFEEMWAEEDAEMMAPQYDRIIDYLIESGNYKHCRLTQLDLSQLEPNNVPQNCGIGAARTLGFDNLVYGCHRMSTAKNKHPIAELVGDRIKWTHPEFYDTYMAYQRIYPERCKECGLKCYCSKCVASMYDYCPDGDPTEYFKAYSQCGWTIASYAGKLAYKDALEKRGLLDEVCKHAKK